MVSVVVLSGLLAAFGSGASNPPTTAPAASGERNLHFVIGSENEAVMQTIVQPWFTQKGWAATYVKFSRSQIQVSDTQVSP
jgi:hypothetical protein